MSAVRKTITLSADQAAWIKTQVSGGMFTNDSEYLRALVNRDRENRDDDAQLRRAIAEGLESGVSERSLNDVWAEGERRAQHSNV